ncbi:hypothetical protein BDR04DRAFT_574767 [Suillus decipiens]|nr:hypothetical protein BDR04DRAFT_574767 [Suillus decipiens]
MVLSPDLLIISLPLGKLEMDEICYDWCLNLFFCCIELRRAESHHDDGCIRQARLASMLVKGCVRPTHPGAALCLLKPAVSSSMRDAYMGFHLTRMQGRWAYRRASLFISISTRQLCIVQHISLPTTPTRSSVYTKRARSFLCQIYPPLSYTPQQSTSHLIPTTPYYWYEQGRMQLCNFVYFAV